jgi:hypothetical protein
MECLIGLCRELCNAKSDDEAQEITKRIAAEIEAIDETERIRNVAWRNEQIRLRRLSEANSGERQ